MDCPATWYSLGEFEEEHMCVLLFGHRGDCLCGSCGSSRTESERRY